MNNKIASLTVHVYPTKDENNFPILKYNVTFFRWGHTLPQNFDNIGKVKGSRAVELLGTVINHHMRFIPHVMYMGQLSGFHATYTREMKSKEITYIIQVGKHNE